MKVVYIYVFDITDSSKKRFLKIGLSSNPKCRIKTLQTGCPFAIKEVFRINLGALESAREVEQKIHERFRKQRVRNTEWFIYGNGCTETNLEKTIKQYKKQYARHKIK